MPRRLLLSSALVALVLALWGVLPVGSVAITNQQKLGDLQNKIEATQGKIGRKKGTERVLSQDIARWTSRIRRLQGRIGSLQSRQSAIQADLDRAQGQLDRTRTNLRLQRARQVRMKARLAVGRRLLAARLVERYQADTPDLVSVILSSNGFAQLLERGEFLRRINDQDERIIRLVAAARIDARDNAEQLATLAKRQTALTTRIAERRNAVASVKQELIDTRVGFDRTRAGKANALSHVRAVREKLEGSLSAMKATQAKIQGILTSPGGANLPAGPIRGGSGAMIWPVNGPITSPFCERRAWEACHPGIDIGVPSGTPIRAALGGRVALAGPTGGYGNYTCIQHTASMSTCYAHQSSIGVSVGQQVSQGQVIGISGCTGLCFGPHLHFEVRINGAVTNPLNYL
jgi:murein DD-endopeptidase MepM/ murein hydrolase activator NlpD